MLTVCCQSASCLAKYNATVWAFVDSQHLFEMEMARTGLSLHPAVCAAALSLRVTRIRLLATWSKFGVISEEASCHVGRPILRSSSACRDMPGLKFVVFD